MTLRGPHWRPWRPQGDGPDSPAAKICFVVGAVLAFAAIHGLWRITDLRKGEAALIGLGIMFIAVVLGVWLHSRNRFG